MRMMHRMKNINWTLRKDLLLIHEKVKSPMNGSGSGAVSSKGGQGLNQSGGSTAESSLEQNQTNFSRTGSGTGYRTGQKKAPEQASEQALNLFYQVLQQE